jgi:hypothetical protein
MPADAIDQYAAKQDSQRAAICHALRKSIDGGLPRATSKLWHGIPVWFVGENPAVGFTARKTGVMLMFWNGQHFDEPELEASGSFHMAQKAYVDASEIDATKLARWLQKAGTSVWDMVGERNAFVAKRKAAKAKGNAKANAKGKGKRAASAKSPVKRTAVKRPAKRPSKKAKAKK